MSSLLSRHPHKGAGEVLLVLKFHPLAQMLEHSQLEQIYQGISVTHALPVLCLSLVAAGLYLADGIH